ncbi:hypothetical protein [Aureispira sp. CCB-E]|uniref:hypothetical protein n=1 Tax=Aureispira sp. CCB-E TaxID=3051121 RepID=UPI0028697813|nr:hypothetical protein [Aureispira sp. CCB-E]WMX13162.1 hypothetical protein QP953_20170 [Aureispira sp. CCB-E]
MLDDDFYSTIKTSFKEFGSKLKLEHSWGLEHFSYNYRAEKERGFGLNNHYMNGSFSLFLHEDSLHVARAHSKDIYMLLKIAFFWVDKKHSLKWIKEKYNIEIFKKIALSNPALEKRWNKTKNSYFSHLHFYENESMIEYEEMSNLIDSIVNHEKLSTFIPSLSHYSLHLYPSKEERHIPGYIIYPENGNSIKIVTSFYVMDDLIPDKKVDESFDEINDALDYYYSLYNPSKTKKQ